MSSVVPIRRAPVALEFFAGVGLARMGLEKSGFRVGWANDISDDKRRMYEAQFVDADSHFDLQDIGSVQASSLPRNAAIAWASSPCTDLSLAGNRTGLIGTHSSAFYGFIDVLSELGEDAPPVAVLENVTGLATSHGGDDLAAAVAAFNSLDYSVDAITLDARRFVPQSRPRLFLIAAKNPPGETEDQPSALRPGWLDPVFSDPTLRMHRAKLPEPPRLVTRGLGASLEKLKADDARWWTADRTNSFIESMSLVQTGRLHALRDRKTISYRTAYRRTRNGVAVWEMRPDDISGCLRTARGGSSKQAVVKLGKGDVQVRWMTGREYARLMGAGEYKVDGFRDSQVHFAFGDAVAVPAVEWLADKYLMPLVKGQFTGVETSHVV